MADAMTDNQKTTAIKVCPRCGREDDKGNVVCPADGTALKTKKVDKLIGTTIADKYEILSMLGKGGMSIVYKGKHKLMDRIVAVKLLRPELVAIPQLVERFKRESKAISAMRHPNIVAVFDFGLMEDATPFLIMDYLEGKTLDKVLKEEGKLDIHRACALVAEAAEGLEHSHHAGIVHRDIKPSNLLLRKEPNGKETLTIFDFGIAKMLSQDGQTIHKLTASGEIFGSPLYMSPEQSEGENIGTRTDIYSLACVLHELLLGKPPFRGDTPVETIMLHMSEPVKPFSLIDPDCNIPDELELVIVKALSKKPDQRYQTIEEFKEAILAAVKTAPPVEQENSSLHSSVPFDGDTDHGDNAANTPARRSLPHPSENKSSKGTIAKVATVGIVLAGVAAVGMFGLKQYNDHQENQAKVTKPADANNGGTTKPADKPNQTEQEVSTRPKDETSLIESIELKSMPQYHLQFSGIPNALNWSFEFDCDEPVAKAPHPLLTKPDETSVPLSQQQPKCDIMVYEVTPAQLSSSGAAVGVFKKYFHDDAQSWQELSVNLSRSYKDLLIQEIQYPHKAADNSDKNVKQFMVYFRKGDRLIAVEFYPTHATYDDVLRIIDTLLPSLEGAIY